MRSFCLNSLLLLLLMLGCSEPVNPDAAWSSSPAIGAEPIILQDQRESDARLLIAFLLKELQQVQADISDPLDMRGLVGDAPVSYEQVLRYAHSRLVSGTELLDIAEGAWSIGFDHIPEPNAVTFLGIPPAALPEYTADPVTAMVRFARNLRMLYDIEVRHAVGARFDVAPLLLRGYELSMRVAAAMPSVFADHNRYKVIAQRAMTYPVHSPQWLAQLADYARMNPKLVSEMDRLWAVYRRKISRRSLGIFFRGLTKLGSTQVQQASQVLKQPPFNLVELERFRQQINPYMEWSLYFADRALIEASHLGTRTDLVGNIESARIYGEAVHHALQTIRHYIDQSSFYRQAGYLIISSPSNWPSKFFEWVTEEQGLSIEDAYDTVGRLWTQKQYEFYAAPHEVNH